MLCCVINVASPAEENSLSAALLALGKANVVEDAYLAQGFLGETDQPPSYFLLYSWFKLFNAAVCVGKTVAFVTADCCSV